MVSTLILKVRNCLVDKYKNGEIVDEDLLNWAQQDTFQEDLNRQYGNVCRC